MDRNMDSGWDVGYVGHYHELKWEPVAGRPVLMGGTLQPTGDYENSLGIAPGRPGAWSHTVTDDEPIDLIRPTYFE
jgi:Rad3-related DNA helicase